jgi:hypothetical protein
MQPIIPLTSSANTARAAVSKWFRLLAFGAAGLALGHSLHAAELLNGGFDTVTGNQSNYWSGTGSPAGALPGTLRGGNQGGYGWDTSYYGGSYPTDNTFASTVGGPVRQDLSGPDNTFVEGVTYTVSMKIFGSGSYAQNSNTMWTLGLTGNGGVVALDHWFSDEFAASTVSAGNGGTIPDDHLTNVGPGGSTGLKTVSLTYTATAADAGKVIGVQLAGDSQTRYTLAPGAPTPDDYYGMMDTVTFGIGALPPVLNSFTSDTDLIDGNPITLSWSIENPASIQTLTLNDGTGPVDVKPDTDPATGLGSKGINPTVKTTYTLTVNGSLTRTLTVVTAKIGSFLSSVPLVTAPSYKTTLSWSFQGPADATVTIFDGATTTDVTADTDSGFGSREFVVPNPSTTFTLNINNGAAIRTVRVLRPVPSDPAKFSLNLDTVYAGETLTASWKDSGNAPESWVGIYRVTDLVGVQYSTSWQYISGYGGATGSVNFNLGAGQYYAVLFVDGAYDIEQGPIAFTVTSEPRAPFIVTAIERVGDTCSFTWNSATGAAYDIYASGDLDTWQLIQAGHPSAGATTGFSEDLSLLPGGVPPSRFYRVAKASP